LKEFSHYAKVVSLYPEGRTVVFPIVVAEHAGDRLPAPLEGFSIIPE